MALPSSGAISMSMVKTEFSSSQTANLSLTGFGAALSTAVTSNIALAASFYGQSGVTLTSFTYFRHEEYPEYKWGSATEACEGESADQQTGYATFPPPSATDGNIYIANSTSEPLEAGFYIFVAGKGSFPFQVTGTSGANSAIGEGC